MEVEAFTIVSTNIFFPKNKVSQPCWILKFVALSPLEHNLDLRWRLKALILSLANPKWNGLLKARLSLSMLEDIRDIVGIGGSWSEFANYFITSLKSQDLKLVLEKCVSTTLPILDFSPSLKIWINEVLRDLSFCGVSHAKLVAQKSKGMPLITIPLTKVVDSTAMEVKLNFCSSLFDAFKMKSMECSLIEEQEHSAGTNMLAAEKERNETIQLEQRQKFQKISDLDNGVSTEGLQNSPDKQATRHGGSTKVKNRKVPAYRRTKVRGALLHDNEE
ncbi:uncharacterized protein LOC106780067 isoform X2 [Vigna radiata var. radiata]|uniref:Uncharacterized protein LOC106780067 isoform X2 n=1 Tax=Vigna radiata var. radiata TaxID=3916 RepID=A0A3Q0ENA9_VIGRR|nr:uncharacterized protein LOC106780067 isoform X2 [Vigna radiata var. radiata]